MESSRSANYLTKDSAPKTLKIDITQESTPPLEDFQPGEENLAPSTEKKMTNDVAQCLKTSTHLGSDPQQNNIFLNKFQCNSTRNSNTNNRYNDQNQQFNFQNPSDRNSSHGPPSEKTAFKKLGIRCGSESNINQKSEEK